MRPGQQNKRGRGRSGSGGNNNNNNRKGQNPLTRTYDSSGPDVKIRGSAQHVAEKYMNLARDAQSSGDRVMAENYLQHAEHYNRIIAAAQAQMQERAQREDRDNQRDEREERDERAVQGRSNQDDDDETGDEVQETDSGSVNGNTAPNRPAASGSRGRPRRAERPAESPVSEPGSPQPVISGIPAEVALEGQASGETGETRTPARRRSRPKRARAEEGSETASADSDAPVNEVAPAD